MESTVMGYIGTAMRIHSFIPSWPKARKSMFPSIASLGRYVTKHGIMKQQTESETETGMI